MIADGGELDGCRRLAARPCPAGAIVAGCASRGARTQARTLTCHPSSRSTPIRRVAFEVERSPAGILRVAFEIDGEIGRLALPAWRGIHPGERLWEHTCVEVFVGMVDREAYHELNVAPSGAWQAHAFTRYRDGGLLAGVAPAPRVAAERGDDRLVVEVEIDVARWSVDYLPAAWRIGLAAVLEDTDGALAYWALAHPPGRPDFHDHMGFALTLDRPQVAAAVSS